MDHSLFRKYERPLKSTGANSKRAALIEPFVEHINADRRMAGFKPLPASKIAVMLSLVPTDDLHAFYKECCGKERFYGFMKWALDAKNANQK